MGMRDTNAMENFGLFATLIFSSFIAFY